jgi:hypothetical protein
MNKLGAKKYRTVMIAVLYNEVFKMQDMFIFPTFRKRTELKEIYVC